MGRTVPTMRQSLEMISQMVAGMDRHATTSESVIIREIALMGRKHAPEASMSGMDPEFAFLISVAIEMQRHIMELKAAINEK
ncbi:MAG: hypothetical protein QXV22_01800 [Thermoplasmataceae archaeon]